jgi:hypothetical protein
MARIGALANEETSLSKLRETGLPAHSLADSPGYLRMVRGLVGAYLTTGAIVILR